MERHAAWLKKIFWHGYQRYSKIFQDKLMYRYILFILKTRKKCRLISWKNHLPKQLCTCNGAGLFCVGQIADSRRTASNDSLAHVEQHSTSSLICFCRFLILA